MNITDVREVVIDPVEEGYKFIVAQLADRNGGKRLVVRANQDCSYHRNILALLWREVGPHGLDAHCTGGGAESKSTPRRRPSISGAAVATSVLRMTAMRPFGCSRRRSQTTRSRAKAVGNRTEIVGLGNKTHPLRQRRFLFGNIII